MEKDKILEFIRNIALLLSAFFGILALSNIYTGESLKGCKVGNTDFDCYSNYYENLVEKRGVPKAFEVLKEESKVNPYLVSQCHPITHIIGHASVFCIQT